MEIRCARGCGGRGGSVKSKVTPGSSALFLLSADAVVDRVKDAFPGGHAELIQSNLESEKEAKLREVFAG
ncbi:DUF1269 domain-containing protein [Streptomyces sp. NPDC059352]|uniref:DUF1269 domain-containing protein n=1 Tax=Streptomyces sp. NPDC059352 TaxID=3346810 RepID=UPI00368A624F